MRCCGRGQRKTSVKVHFPGGPVSPRDRLTPYDRTVSVAERFAEVVVTILPAVDHDTAISALS
jgi:hypothetical protein